MEIDAHGAYERGLWPGGLSAGLLSMVEPLKVSSRDQNEQTRRNLSIQKIFLPDHYHEKLYKQSSFKKLKHKRWILLHSVQRLLFIVKEMNPVLKHDSFQNDKHYLNIMCGLYAASKTSCTFIYLMQGFKLCKTKKSMIPFLTTISIPALWRSLWGEAPGEPLYLSN